MTRLNVYAGPAGFFLVRGGPEGDKAVRDSRTNTTAAARPRPNENDMFPPNKTYFEIPIAVQDRSFNTNGSLFYPNTRAFFDGYAGPYIPGHRCVADLEPGVLRQHDHGQRQHLAVPDCPAASPAASCSAASPFRILDFSHITGVEVWQIGNEEGFPDRAPVNLTASNGNRLLLGLAERADLIVDFTNVLFVPSLSWATRPDEPFGAVASRTKTSTRRRSPPAPARSCSSGSCPQSRLIRPPRRGSWSCRPSPNSPAAPPGRWPCWSRWRRSSPTGRPHGWASSRGTLIAKKWMDEVTEDLEVNTTEVWEYYNATADASTRCTSTRSPSRSSTGKAWCWTTRARSSSRSSSLATRLHRSPGRTGGRTP